MVVDASHFPFLSLPRRVRFLMLSCRHHLHICSHLPDKWLALADCVCLPRLALQRVLFLLVVAVCVFARAFSGVTVLLNMLQVGVDLRLVHGHQRLDRQADVRDERVAAGAREIFADDDCAWDVSQVA